jgi:hypothetical protein
VACSSEGRRDSGCSHGAWWRTLCLAIARAGGPIYAGKENRPVDCGDVPGNMQDFIEYLSAPIFPCCMLRRRRADCARTPMSPRAKYEFMEGERTAG